MFHADLAQIGSNCFALMARGDDNLALFFASGVAQHLAERAFFHGLLLRFIEDLLNLSSQTAGCNRLHSVEHRIARWLLMASDRVGSDVLPLTQQRLAAMLGVRRTGISETAGELQRSGLIRYRRGEITIIDRAGLETIACECYAVDQRRLGTAT